MQFWHSSVNGPVTAELSDLWSRLEFCYPETVSLRTEPEEPSGEADWRTCLRGFLALPLLNVWAYCYCTVFTTWDGNEDSYELKANYLTLIWLRLFKFLCHIRVLFPFVSLISVCYMILISSYLHFPSLHTTVSYSFLLSVFLFFFFYYLAESSALNGNKQTVIKAKNS